MESLTDTILSMTLAPAVEESQSRLTTEKLTAIRELLRNRKIAIIKPQRPDRVGLNSEVILETKMKSDRKIRDGAATNMDKMEQERIKTEQQRVLTKPTATKAVAPSMASISQPNAPTSFGFGGISPFVKPSPGKPEDFKKDQPQQQPAIVKPVASTAAPMFLKATPSTTSTTQPFAGYGAAPNANPTFTGFSITPTTMPAFSGFGTNAPLTFGAPKPLIPNVPAKEPSNAENAQKDQPQPLFPSKPFASESKPFASSSFSSPFTVVAPSKSAEPADKENKVPEIQPFVPVGGKSETSAAPISFSAALASVASSVASSAAATTAFSFISATAASQAKTTASTPFTFSFGSALNSEDSTGTGTQGIQLSFAGLAKPTPVTTPAATKPEVPAGTQSKTDSTESVSDGSSSINLGTLGVPITPNPSPTPFASTADNIFSAATSVAKASTSVADSTDSLFGGLNICKPNTSESVAFKPTFGGFGPITSEATQEVKSIFGATAASTKESTGFTGFGITPNATKSSVSTSTVATAPSTAASTSTSEAEPAQTFSFGITTTTPNATKSAFEAPAVSASSVTTIPSTTASTSTSTTTTTTTESLFEPSTAQGFSFGITTSAVATPPAWSASSQASTTSTAPSLFTSPTGASVFAVATTSATTTAPAGGSLFGGLSFGTPTSQATPSIFSATATSAAASTPSSIVSPFAGVNTAATTSAAPIATPFGTAASTAASSIFASAAATTTPAATPSAGNIFGGIPKPDQSVFGRSEGNVFGGTSADSSASGGSLFGGQTSVFGGQPKAASGGSIFGGSASGTGQISSPFGAASNTANAGGNIFGSPTPSSTTNVFGTNTQSTTASGGSIFDQSSAGGQSGGSLFSAFGQTASPFAATQESSGSIFGGSANAASPKPSAFGSPTPAASAFGSVNTGGFGAFSQTPAFGSQAQAGANTGGGAFAQSGSSITQTGFGSPSSGTAFAKPVFGGAPAFGAAPAFGSPPSFGSAPSFGSPKGFGSFAAPVATGGAFTSPTQKNNLFEALGSSDTGLSFGNLAQNTNANQQKPAFGGSSFMSYRS